MKETTAQLTRDPNDKDPLHKKQPIAAAATSSEKRPYQPFKLKVTPPAAAESQNQPAASTAIQETETQPKSKPKPAAAGPGQQDPERTVPVVPMSSRPTPQSQQAKRGDVVVAEKLAGNLGTAPEIEQQMQIDERKFSVLTPESVTAYNYLGYRGQVDGIRFWDWFVDWELAGNIGIGGLGRQHILKAFQFSAGSQPIEKANKPNMIARNLWKRNWKEKASSEGKDVEE